jgi:hypothetical protein
MSDLDSLQDDTFATLLAAFDHELAEGTVHASEAPELSAELLARLEEAKGCLVLLHRYFRRMQSDGNGRSALGDCQSTAPFGHK